MMRYYGKKRLEKTIIYNYNRKLIYIRRFVGRRCLLADSLEGLVNGNIGTERKGGIMEKLKCAKTKI